MASKTKTTLGKCSHLVQTTLFYNNCFSDKPSLWTVIITAALILIIVTVGVIVRFTLEELPARIVLICLIILVVILGMSALSYLEVRRRKVQSYNKTLQTKNGGYIYKNINQASHEPSAPKDPNWEYSNRDTMQVS